MIRCDPLAGVAHSYGCAFIRRTRKGDDLSAYGMTQRVLDEIAEYLSNPRRICTDDRGAIIYLASERDAFLLRRWTDRIEYLLDLIEDAHSLDTWNPATGFDSRKVEHVLDYTLHSRSVGKNRPCELLS